MTFLIARSPSCGGCVTTLAAAIAHAINLHMLVLGLGKEHTAAEFGALLDRAGFALERAAPASGGTGVSILEAACA